MKTCLLTCRGRSEDSYHRHLLDRELGEGGLADIQPPQRAGHVVVGSHYPHRKHVRRRRHRLPSTGDLAAAAAAAAAPQRRLLPFSLGSPRSPSSSLPSHGRRDERRRRAGVRGCGAAAPSSHAPGERQRERSPGAFVGSDGVATTAAAAGNHTGSSVPGCSSCCHDDDVTDATTGGGEEGGVCAREWRRAGEGGGRAGGRAPRRGHPVGGRGGVLPGPERAASGRGWREGGPRGERRRIDDSACGQGHCGGARGAPMSWMGSEGRWVLAAPRARLADRHFMSSRGGGGGRREDFFFPPLPNKVKIRTLSSFSSSMSACFPP